MIRLLFLDFGASEAPLKDVVVNNGFDLEVLDDGVPELFGVSGLNHVSSIARSRSDCA